MLPLPDDLFILSARSRGCRDLPDLLTNIFTSVIAADSRKYFQMKVRVPDGGGGGVGGLGHLLNDLQDVGGVVGVGGGGEGSEWKRR